MTDRIVTHPLSGEVILFSPERGARPNAFAIQHKRPRGSAASCPFCPGHESETPPEITRVGEPWRLRVVPNKYPIVQPDSGVAHEVLIESAHHDAQFEDLSVSEITEILRLYRQRLIEHEKGPAAYISLFRNEGEAAGQSIDHLHSQLLALKTIPPRIEKELAAFAEKCVVCDITARTDYLVVRSSRFAVISPPFARLPYEVWIVPTMHAPSFAAITDPDLEDLGNILLQAVQSLRRLHPDAGFNWSFLTLRPEATTTYHWRIEMTPRLTQLGGFELGSGAFINIVDPLQAARELRDSEAGM